MNTQIEHAHMNIKTCIERDQNKYECVPGQRVIMRYQERGVSAQLKNNLMFLLILISMNEFFVIPNNGIYGINLCNINQALVGTPHACF